MRTSGPLSGWGAVQVGGPNPVTRGPTGLLLGRPTCPEGPSHPWFLTSPSSSFSVVLHSLCRWPELPAGFLGGCAHNMGPAKAENQVYTIAASPPKCWGALGCAHTQEASPGLFPHTGSWGPARRQPQKPAW